LGDVFAAMFFCKPVLPLIACSQDGEKQFGAFYLFSI